MTTSNAEAREFWDAVPEKTSDSDHSYWSTSLILPCYIKNTTNLGLLAGTRLVALRTIRPDPAHLETPKKFLRQMMAVADLTEG